jgi:NitT/TauT family transport system substrate-binding protein
VDFVLPLYHAPLTAKAKPSAPDVKMIQGPRETSHRTNGPAAAMLGRARRAALAILSSVLSILVLFSVSFSQEVPAENPKKVAFIPQWVPQAQFAGYYVASEKGIYRRHGLNVTILPGGPDFPPSKLMQSGEADFGTMFLASALEQRANGVRLVNIAQIVQRSAFMLVAKKSSGIRTPTDLDGRKVGLWGSEFKVQATGLFQKFGVQVSSMPQRQSITLFLWDGVDAASAMWYNEYHTILNAGIDADELVAFFLRDYGFDIPEDGLYCLEETWLADPGSACSFVAASAEGWQYAFAHPEEAIDIVMRYIGKARIPNSRVHQRWMLNRMRDIISPADADIPLGMLQPSVYERAGRDLVAGGLIERYPDFREFHRSCDAAKEN